MTAGNVCIAYGSDISILRGGVNRIIAFVSSLQDNGFDVELVVPKPIHKIPEDLQNVKIHTIPVKEGGFLNKIAIALLVSYKAKKIAKNSNMILQIEHSNLAGFATLVGCSGFILDMHDLFFESPLYGNLLLSILVQKFIYNIEKRAVTHASKIIVVSNPMKEFIVRKWGVQDDKISVIPNGYFEKKFKHLNLDDVEEVKGMIAFLGRLDAKLDLNKITDLAKSVKDAMIYIIGDGPMRDKLERKVRESKLENIIVTGELSDKEAFGFVANAQVTIHPLLSSLSTEVSCPVKLFDYAALGKAIVADDVSEMHRIFKENNAILISNPTNQEKFIENVRIILENDDIRYKIALNAKRLVKDYTWEKQGKKLVKIYEQLLSNNCQNLGECNKKARIGKIEL